LTLFPLTCYSARMKSESIHPENSSPKLKNFSKKIWRRFSSVVTEPEVDNEFVKSGNIFLQKKEINRNKRILFISGIAPAIVGGICYLAQPGDQSKYIFGASVAFAVAFIVLVGASCKKSPDKKNPPTQ
jgi:hypothetical protein